MPTEGRSHSPSPPDPDRAVRASQALLRRCAAMFEAMARAVDERGERISFKVIETPDGRKNVWELEKRTDDVAKLLAFAKSLRETSDRLKEPISLLTPSRAMKLWNQHSRQAHASVRPTAYDGSIGKKGIH